MQTFFLFGKYSASSVKEINTDRTEQAVRLVSDLGGEVKSMYALLGIYDIIVIAEFSKIEIAMKASLGLSVLTGVSFDTFPAVPVEDFDKLLWEGVQFYKEPS